MFPYLILSKQTLLQESTTCIKELLVYLRRLYRYRSLYNYHKYGAYGNAIRIDASSICQLECPGCGRTYGGSTGMFKNGIKEGYLKFINFKKTVDENPWIKRIELSGWGEIFLNPDLMSIVEYAHSKGVSLTAGAGVNLNTISEEMIESLVRCKFRYISVSIDGAGNDTYKIYRKGGDFNKVIENIKKINFYKKKYNTQLPELVWGFIVFDHNLDDLPVARDMAKKLNMHFKLRLNSQAWNPSYSSIRDEESAKKISGLRIVKVEEFEKRYNRSYKSLCYQLWLEPHINWDGRLLGCCINTNPDFGFGNIFESGLVPCLKSAKYIYVKEMLIGKEAPGDNMACSRCPRYKNRFLPRLLRLNHALGLI